MADANQSVLTAEFCKRNYVVFHPSTIEEALFIQQRLAEFGIRWVDGGPIGYKVLECVANGMVVQEGKLYHSPTNDARNVLCTIEQFDRNYLTPERAFMVEQFNKLAGRIDALVSRIEALEKKVDAVHEAAFPDLANTKPGLRRAP